MKKQATKKLIQRHLKGDKKDLDRLEKNLDSMEKDDAKLRAKLSGKKKSRK